MSIYKQSRQVPAVQGAFLTPDISLGRKASATICHTCRDGLRYDGSIPLKSFACLKMKSWHNAALTAALVLALFAGAFGPSPCYV
jgi:hypothetical protein